MIKSDWDFAVKKLDDNQATAILQLLDKTPESERFAKEMLISPRSTGVWRQASLRLYEFAGEQTPKEWNYQMALARFSPEKLSEVKLSPSPSLPLTAPPPALTLSPIRPLPINEKAPISLPKTLAAKDALSSDPLANKPRTAKKAAPPPQPISSTRTYTVQKGDSLWKISQKFKVDVNALKEGNQLQSDAIKPGMVLKIP
jgi:nucleoid-associated protein YgaU